MSEGGVKAAAVAEHLFAQVGPIGAPAVLLGGIWFELPEHYELPLVGRPSSPSCGLWWRSLAGRSLPDVRR